MPPSPSRSPLQILVASAYADRRFLSALQNHLALLCHRGQLRIVHPGQLVPGVPREPLLAELLQRSQLVVPLLSAHLLGDREACALLEQAQALARVRRGQLRIVPILVRPVDLAGSYLERLAWLPRSGQAVSLHKHPDLVWVEIARGLVACLQSAPTAVEPPGELALRRVAKDRVKDLGARLHRALHRR